MLTVMEETLDIYINDGISHQTDSNEVSNQSKQLSQVQRITIPFTTIQSVHNFLQ